MIKPDKNTFCFGWLYNNNIHDGITDQVTKNIFDFELTMVNYLAYASFENDNSFDLCKNAYDAGYKKILVVKLGNVFNMWLETFMKEYHKYHEAVFVGHILDMGEKYYTFHEQFFMLDLEWWASLGFENFGERSGMPWNTVEPIRSEENFHGGGYTPLWIQSGNTEKTYQRKLPGWNLISKALEHKKQIMCWQKEIRECKEYLYGEVKEDAVYNKYHIFQSTELNEKFFIGNTESISQKTDRETNSLVIPAAGINPIVKAFYSNCTRDSKITIYDYKDKYLEMCKFYLNNIDFNNFDNTIEKLNDKYNNGSDNLHDTFNGVHEIKYIKNVIALANINGKFEKWYHEEFKNMTIAYKKCNLFNKHKYKHLLHLLDPHPKAQNIIHISNIFNFKPTATYFSLHERVELFKCFINTVEEKLPHKNYEITGVFPDELEGNFFKWQKQT